MIWPDDFEDIAQRLGDKLEHAELLKETYGSKLYLLRGEKEYVLKHSKGGSIAGEYRNHKCVYDIWAGCDGVGFMIPEPYFLAGDESYYVMEHVKGAVGLREVLPKYGMESLDIYKRVGSCLKDYHEMMTDNLHGDRVGIESHVTIAKLLKRNDGNRVREILGEFREDSYKVIFKDFTFSNVVLDEDGKIYFIDFQKIDFFAPFYYDLARFIDTLKVFTFTKHPLFWVSHVGLIKKTADSFLAGYSDKIDKELLAKMQSVHRQEHILTKSLQKPLHGLILKCLYSTL